MHDREFVLKGVLGLYRTRNRLSARRASEGLFFARKRGELTDVQQKGGSFPYWGIYGTISCRIRGKEHGQCQGQQGEVRL